MKVLTIIVEKNLDDSEGQMNQALDCFDLSDDNSELNWIFENSDKILTEVSIRSLQLRFWFTGNFVFPQSIRDFTIQNSLSEFDSGLPENLYIRQIIIG